MGTNEIAILGAIVGAMAGSLTFLFKQLVDTKNHRINELVDERDYWRDMLIRNQGRVDMSVMDYQQWWNARHPPAPQPHPGLEKDVN